MENILETNVYFADVIEKAAAPILSKDHLSRALKISNDQHSSLIDVIVREGYCKKQDILPILADFFVMSPVYPLDEHIPPDAVSSLPPELAEKYGVMPVKREDNVIYLAVSDPLQFEVVDNLRLQLGLDIEPMLALKSEIEGCLKVYYPKTAHTQDIMHQLEETAVAEEADNVELVQHGEGSSDEEGPVIKLVSMIIIEAFKNRASDIHFEPLVNRFRVRYRIDGILHEVAGPPKRLQSAVISRLKIMAGMSISEKRIPQDGRIKLNILGKEIDLRVSAMPIAYGESIVLRILDKSGVVMGLSELGFLPDDQKKFESLLTLPNGIILITGPTGSGKTSTLYTALANLNKPNRKIITVEDPIEYQISGINQVQVNEAIGRTFSGVLRSMLRQAPNVIMVGEIRDLDVANIAVNASFTGHLVFSTLHTNDAASSFTRLTNMGVKPYLVATAVQAVLAQRLVRRVCSNCKEPYRPGPEYLAATKLSPEELKKTVFYHGKGCIHCSGTGYRGRMCVLEMLMVSEAIKELIYANDDSNQIKKRAVTEGMRTLLVDGVAKVTAGMTTIEELLRVAQE